MRNIIKQHPINKGKAILAGLGSALVFGSATQATFDGLYAGVSLGYMNQSITINASQNPTNPNADIYKSTAGRGLPTAEFFFGWGKVFEGRFYGGLEGKVDWATGSIKKVAEDVNFTYLAGRKGLGIGVLARLGYLVSPHTMVYGGVGVKATRFGYNLFQKVDKIPTSFSQQSLNLLTEMGIETFLNAQKTLALRLSYSFMPAKGVTRTMTSFPEGHIYRDDGFFKASTTEHTFKAGVTYRF